MPLTPPSSSSTPSRLPEAVQAFDRRVGRRINGRPSDPAADRALLAVSTAANNGLLWFSVAAALALTGPRGRRAAARGLASLGLSSGFANLVAKPLVGGPRPSADDVPPERQLARFPQSASFPSGHTASAIAFASGVAIESPALGLVVAPLAVTVAYSRLHVGAHWLSDVLGGAAIGVTMANVARLLPLRWIR
ncbi:phosphatase PAP2 family protein [Frondihabitans australicus]|uniref:PAP2 superfamily protein n=1 Tax=Frondihabitans australicus TaxID=386892 RepID=A0A495IGY5_9MICO|nr:phosphatase PAP2 family protein [Frondihabitans australicus]RKR74571.1 PAP2 superfamily protein [Frondihabitans australicus]